MMDGRVRPNYNRMLRQPDVKRKYLVDHSLRSPGRERLPLMRMLPWLLIIGAAVGCAPRNEYVAPPPPQVTVAQPVERNVTDYLEFTGGTRAIDTVQIRARVNGYLKEIKFEDGQDVEQGDLLLVVDPKPFKVALASAEASLQKAEARLVLANADLKRTMPLVERGALPQQELDVKRADVATAQADVGTAKAAIDEAQLNLDYTEVRAPISGRVGQHMLDIGNLVQAETTILARIESYEPIHAYFAVGEKDVLRLPKVDNTKPVSAKNGEDNKAPPRALVLMGLSDTGGFPYEGELDYADLGLDPATGTQMRRATFKNADHKLVPGLFVRIRLAVGPAAPRLMIDERAIAADQQGEYLLVVNEDNVVEYRQVELGIRDQGMRVVSKGLAADEWVVVNGLQRARPGAPVSPKQQKPAAVAATAAITPNMAGD
jgi:RND family efflux transporter MFP subunit